MKSKRSKQSAAAVVGATPSVLGPTPLSDIPFHGCARQQRRAAAQDDLVDGDTRKKQPATIKVVNFHKVPPRTQIVEKENTGDDTDAATIKFKERSKLLEAPGLGEISATIWAKTSASKGGAKDPAAAVVSRAVHIAKKKAELSEGDERTALLNCDGFKAYAAEMIWGARAPGESDDAPLDQGDPLQVRGRLREVWRSWRKLPVDKQKDWAKQKLSQDMAAVLRQASGAAQPQPLGKRPTSAGEPASKSKKGGSRKDGWRYAAPPKHSNKTSKASAESDQDEEERPASGKPQKRRKAAAVEIEQEAAADREYDAVEGDDATLDDEYRRAVMLHVSKTALLAEMRCWEQEDEEQEAAAVAGMSIAELRKHRKEAAVAAAAAAAEEGDGAEEDTEEPAAVGRGKKRKAARAGAKKVTTMSAAVRRSNRTTQKQQQEEEQSDDEEMADVKDGDDDDDVDDDEADVERQEAELEKALADADDSDEDNEASSSSDEEEEPEEPEPPVKKAKTAVARKPSKKAAPKPSKKTADKEKSADGKKKADRHDSTDDKAAPVKSDISKKTGKISKKTRATETKTAAAAQPQKDEAGTSAAAASAGTSKQRSSATTGKAAQSPNRKSQRHQKEEQQEQQQVDEDDGPAVSGAGKSSGPRRGRSAGGAQAARIEYLEKSLFSNTRRSSYGRADSPGLAALAAGSKRPSRLSKNKN